MHDYIKIEAEMMGMNTKKWTYTPEAEQDIIIMSRLMKITRSDDFTEEELQFYQNAAAVENQQYVKGSRILTKDFNEEELNNYQWYAEHPTGSCRGFRLTEDPTEKEVKVWQETMEWINKLDFVALRNKVEFEREDNLDPRCF
jgi:hypothetical protein